LVDNAGTEALRAEFAKPNEGFVWKTDELAAFFGAMDRYAKGSRGGSSDSAFYLSAYGGGAARDLRISRGRTEAEKTHLSIVGGIQPAVLSPLLQNLGADGLLQRFFACVMAESPSATDERPVDPVLADTYRQAVRLLLTIVERQGDVLLRPTREAVEEWRALDRWTLGDGMARAASETERGFVGKLPQVTARFAAALHCIEWACREASEIVTGTQAEADPLPEIVAAETVRKAVLLARKFALPHARALYSLATQGTALDDAKAVAKWLLSLPDENARQITLRSIYRDLRWFERHRDRLEAALEMLENYGWLSAEQKVGKSTFRTLNPEVRRFIETEE
jgi:hypothetical protein